ncbi:MAG: FAD-binding oxidoreductase [Proteobacteria bacterium]|nr:FAD-binding oxidoreductase [Pseudomonadota bacterium]
MTSAPFDAAVIGGGVMGCSTALQLARGGMRVILFERGGLCMEASGVNAGSLSPMIKRSMLIPHAMRSYDIWQNSAKTLGMDVGGHRMPGLIAAYTDGEAEELESIMIERRDAGCPIEIVGPNRARELEPGLSDSVKLAAYCERDGHGDSSRSGKVFRNALTLAQVDLRTHTQVTGVDRAGDGFAVSAASGVVHAKRVVLAGGAWLGRMCRWLGYPLDVRFKVNQLVVTERIKPVVRTVLGVSNGMLTLKQSANGTVVLGGGWQGFGDLHQGGVELVADSVIGNLKLARVVIPGLTDVRVMRSWLGMEALMPSYDPVIGAVPDVENAFIIGCVRGGWEIGPCLGALLGDLILGREPDLPLFTPPTYPPGETPPLFDPPYVPGQATQAL